MGINVSGRNCKLWIKEHEGNTGSWVTYSTSVSGKTKEGDYANAYCDLRFAKAVFVPESVKNGSEFDFEGFMSVKFSRDKEGNEAKRPIIIVMKAKFRDDGTLPTFDDTFEDLDEDVPF